MPHLLGAARGCNGHTARATSPAPDAAYEWGDARQDAADRLTPWHPGAGRTRLRRERRLHPWPANEEEGGFMTRVVTRGWAWRIAVLAGLLAWPGARAVAGESPDVTAGRDLFEQHCELCHGAEGLGDGPLSDELRVAPADLTRISARRAGTFPEVEVREIIDGRRRVRAHGKSEMPIWGRAFGGGAAADAAKQAEVQQKLDQLVAFLRSIQRGGPETVGER
jgi:mono/diheme cytochrome c family protein